MRTAPTFRAMFLSGIAVATLVCAPSTTNAQAPSPIPSVSLKPHIYLAGGTATVANPSATKDILNQSLSLMVAVGLPLNLGLEIIPKVQYHKFNLSNDFILASSITTKSPKMTILTLGADLKMGLLPGPVPAKPYFLIGGGTANIKWDDLGVSLPSVSSTKIYLNIGGGLDVKVGPSFSFFVEGKYTFVSADGANLGIVPLMAGIRIM
ncbi:hypothetical protein JYU19_00985 [bacterium AH-315-J21]|nr:hypothetical protein [bacterium AH-315-J21]